MYSPKNVDLIFIFILKTVKKYYLLFVDVKITDILSEMFVRLKIFIFQASKLFLLFFVFFINVKLF